MTTINDITDGRESESQFRGERYAASIFNTVREPLLVLDADLRVRSANRSFYQRFHAAPHETLNQPIYELCNHQWDVPELRRLLSRVLSERREFAGFEVSFECVELGRRSMFLNARAVVDNGSPQLILLAIEDVTEKVQAAELMIQLNEELEQRIAERTVDLERLSHELATEIVDCWRLERRLAKITEAERQRMGHELHDVFGQQVTAIGVLVEHLYQTLQADSSPHMESAACLREAVQKAKTDLRALCNGLFPVDVHAQGLCFALEELARRTCDVYDVRCTFTQQDAVPVEDNYKATHLYWIASEAVHNAVVHARPRHIAIHLERDRGAKLTVRDDGAGIHDDPDEPAGMGLRIMRHRARLIGGRFYIGSSAEGGTVVTCAVQTSPRVAGSADVDRDGENSSEAG